MRSIVVSTALHFVGWLAVLVWVVGRAPAPAPAPEVMQLRRLDLVDESGRVVATLSAVGGTRVQLADPDGTASVAIDLLPGTASVRVRAGAEAAALQAGPAGTGLTVLTARPELAVNVQETGSR